MHMSILHHSDVCQAARIRARTCVQAILPAFSQGVPDWVKASRYGYRNTTNIFSNGLQVCREIHVSKDVEHVELDYVRAGEDLSRQASTIL